MKRRLIVVLSMFISLMFIKLFVPTIFFGDTPRVNPRFLATLANAPATLARSLGVLGGRGRSAGSSEAPVVTYSQMNSLYTANIMRPYAEGVYAYDDGKIIYYRINQNEINYKQITVKTNKGNMVTLKFPENQPPVKEILEAIQND